MACFDTSTEDCAKLESSVTTARPIVSVLVPSFSNMLTKLGDDSVDVEINELVMFVMIGETRAEGDGMMSFMFVSVIGAIRPTRGRGCSLQICTRLLIVAEIRLQVKTTAVCGEN